MTAQTKTIADILLQGIFLGILLAFAFPGVVLDGETLIPADTLLKVNPWKGYGGLTDDTIDNRLTLDSISAMNTYYVLADRAIEQGEWPLWNTYEFCGMPLLANYQSAVLYPPRLLHLLFDLATATTMYILLKLWLCGMTAYFCAREMGVGASASRFASVGWMLCSYNVVWCYWPLPDVSAWAPILILGVECILDARYKRGFYALLIGAAMILLAGHPETAFVFGAGSGTYFVARLLLERRKGRELWTPLAIASAGWCVGLLLAAAQIIPFLEYIANAPAHGGGLAPSPGTVISFWLPRFYGLNALKNFWGTYHSNITMMLYPGMAAWLGVGLLIVAMPRSQPARARVVGLLLASVIFAFMGFNAFPFSYVTALPPLNMVYHHYCLPMAVLGIVFVATIGLDQWIKEPRTLRHTVWVLTPVVIALPVIGWVCLFNASFIRNARMVSSLTLDITIALAFLVTGFIVLLFHAAGRSREAAGKARPVWCAAALTLLLAGDLLLASRDTRPTCPEKYVYFRTDLTDFLCAQKPLTRVDASYGGIPCGILPVYGIEEFRGYDGIYPNRMRRFRERLGVELHTSMGSVCAVNYYLRDIRVPKPSYIEEYPERYELVGSLDDIEIYRNLAALPRAFLVAKARVVDSEDEMFALMSSDQFDPTQCVLLEELPEGPLPDREVPCDVGSAMVTQRSCTKLAVRARAKGPCMLVVSEGYFPGWNATIDGCPTKILSAYYAFRAVYLPAGEHDVVFTYEPRSFRVGLAISVSTLIGCVAAFIFTRGSSWGVTPYARG